MEAYAEFAMNDAKSGLGFDDFARQCIHGVSRTRFNLDPLTMRCGIGAVASGMCVFSGDLFIYNDYVPTKNYSEAFQLMISMGINQQEMKLFKESNGQFNFAMNMLGMQKCVPYIPAIQDILNHCAFIISAHEIYKSAPK